MHDDLTKTWAGLKPKQAIALQKNAAGQISLEDDLPEIRTVAGVDVGIENRTTARAAIVVLRLDDLTPVDYATAKLPVPMPYIPGLLSFRECPVILEALAKLTLRPDLLLCDGHGIAHPRRLGVAAHTGLLTGLPAIGVAKSRLTGTHSPIPQAKGDWTPLWDRGEEIGAVLRTRQGVKPLYISPGHRISLPTAINYVMACVTRYRLPQTTRWADGLASARGYKWLQQLESLDRS
jgi:deoxyribonuclease V